MSAPPAEVTDRLERLAAHAPGGALDPDLVWARGRRRRRVRLGAALTAVVAVGLLGTTTTPLLVERAQRVAPAGVDDRMVLPDVLRQPGGWEPSFPAAPGRLSAVGVGTRSGLWSDRTTPWGVAAATGESRFLDLPGAAGHPTEPALSADGRRLAYWLESTADAGALGTAGESILLAGGVVVMDLESGERQVWAVDSPHGLWVGGMAWAGDVLWWSAGPARSEEASAVATRRLVRTWDVRTGHRDEWRTGPRGRLGVDGVGSAPSGFVEASGSLEVRHVTGGAAPDVLRTIPSEGAPDQAGITQPVMSTDGSRVAVLLMPDAGRHDDAPKPLLVGDLGPVHRGHSGGGRRGRRVALRHVADVEVQSILGWRSPTQVVVADQEAVEEGRVPSALRAWAADVATGERTPLVRFIGNTPQVAAEAWRAEVVPAPDAPFAPDPRVVGAALLGLALVAWRAVLVVRRRRGHA